MSDRRLPPKLPRLLGALAVAVVLQSAHATTEILKSPNDTREYLAFELDNGIRALVISDPESDKAAASVEVRVGSASDPKGREGLAHFLEHMLFLGTEKYPEPGSYQAFIAAHGGRHNAYTAIDRTNYFFDIDDEYLEPALDRLAQFFVTPLFSEEYVEREKLAVHSEYQLKIKNDGWRGMQAFKEVLNPDHPMSQFSIGSTETLADREEHKVRDDLIRFYKDHYSAGMMSVVVLGREPVEELENWVREKFSAITNTGTERLAVPEPLFREGQLPARLDVIPLKEERQLRLTFPIPSSKPHFKAKPTYYIAYLLGHEGKGSLLSLLKENQWAEGLNAGEGRSLGNQATFDISIRLTEKGLEHVNEVIESVFQYIRLVTVRGVNERLFDEQRRLAEVDFAFLEKGDAVGYVSSLSSHLQDYPPHYVLKVNHLIENYDPKLLKSYLRALNPENVLVTVMAQGLETDSVAAWFDTPYGLSDIEPEMVERWKSSLSDRRLAIPGPNIFVPTDLTVKELGAHETMPRLVRKSDGLEVWFKQDEVFRVPKADLNFEVRSHLTSASPKNLVLTKLYLDLVHDQLTEYTYPASLAGLGYSLDVTSRGIEGSVSGFSDKQLTLLGKIVETLREPILNGDRFSLFKARLLRKLDNATKESPYEQAIAEVPNILVEPRWSKPEQLEATRQVTIDDLRDFVPELFARIEIAALANGNLRVADALAMGEVLERSLLQDSEPQPVARPRLVKLEPGELALRELDVDHDDSAIVLYFQGPQSSFEERARFGLLAQILSSPFYEDLRTDKQLGYVVFASAMPLLEVPGVVFTVQSPRATPAELEGHIERFLSDYRGTLAGMEIDAFQRHKQGLLTRLTEKPTSLTEQTSRYWSDLGYGHLSFDSRQRIADAVEALQQDEILAELDRSLLSADRRRLIVGAPGNQVLAAQSDPDRKATDRLQITDTRVFKRGRELFPN